MLFLAQTADAQTYYFWRKRSHASDITTITDGKSADLGLQENNNTLYRWNTGTNSWNQIIDTTALKLDGTNSMTAPIMNSVTGAGTHFLLNFRNETTTGINYYNDGAGTEEFRFDVLVGGVFPFTWWKTDLNTGLSTFNSIVSQNSVTATTSLIANNGMGGVLTLSPGSITDASGAISFDNENLTTTGFVGIGATPTYQLDTTGSTTLISTRLGNTDPSVTAFGTVGVGGSNAFIGSYYAAAGNISNIYYGQNYYFTSGGWNIPDANKKTGLFIMQGGSQLWYVSNANGVAPTLKMQLSGTGAFQLYNVANIGTTTGVEIYPDLGASGEMVAGAYVGGTTGGLSLLANTGGTNGKILQGVYYNGGWVSAWEVANTTGGAYSNLYLMRSGGNVSIGVGQTATARLHLPAGTATASTAPLKFNSGTSLTTAEAGAMEFTTDDLYFTITTGTARKNIALWDTLGTSGHVPYVTTNGRLKSQAPVADGTYTVGDRITPVTGNLGTITITNGIISAIQQAT